MNSLSNITNKQLKKPSETIKIKPPLGMYNKTHCKSQCNNKFNYENQLAINKL
jgi:PHP family Zn ribbon phosphoesterase